MRIDKILWLYPSGTITDFQKIYLALERFIKEKREKREKEKKIGKKIGENNLDIFSCL
jgi:hypothetical protein